MDGKVKTVHPHLILKRLQGGTEILKTKLENEHCMNIPLQNISQATILKENFAIDSKCLVYDFQEFEILYPKMEDWFTPADAQNSIQ